MRNYFELVTFDGTKVQSPSWEFMQDYLRECDLDLSGTLYHIVQYESQSYTDEAEFVLFELSSSNEPLMSGELLGTRYGSWPLYEDVYQIGVVVHGRLATPEEASLDGLFPGRHVDATVAPVRDHVKVTSRSHLALKVATQLKRLNSRKARRWLQASKREVARADRRASKQTLRYEARVA